MQSVICTKEKRVKRLTQHLEYITMILDLRDIPESTDTTNSRSIAMSAGEVGHLAGCLRQHVIGIKKKMMKF